MQLDEEIKLLEDEDLIRHIQQVAKNCFSGQSPKQLQVKAVLSLARRQHTFLLAGMGSGKSRMAKMFHAFFDPSKSPIVLVLNP